MLHLPYIATGKTQTWAHADAGWLGYRIGSIRQTETGMQTKTSIRVRSGGTERTEALPYTVQADEAIYIDLEAGESLVPANPLGALTLGSTATPYTQEPQNVTPTAQTAARVEFEVAGGEFYDLVLPSGYSWELRDASGNFVAGPAAGAERQNLTIVPSEGGTLVISAPEGTAGLWSEGAVTEFETLWFTGNARAVDLDLVNERTLTGVGFPFAVVTGYYAGPGDVVGLLSADTLYGQAVSSLAKLPNGRLGVVRQPGQMPIIALRDEDGIEYTLTFTRP